MHRAIALVPVAIPVVAGTLAFTLLLNPADGAINRLLGAVGLPRPLWLFGQASAKPALLLLALWGSGTTIVIVLAAIGHVPRSYHDAAEVDGAGRLARFRHVTVPLIAPVVTYATIVGVLQAFQYFSQPYVANGVAGASLGSPGGSTLFYPSWLYRQGFQNGRLGLAAAMGSLLLVFVLVAVAAALGVSRRAGVRPEQR